MKDRIQLGFEQFCTTLKDGDLFAAYRAGYLRSLFDAADIAEIVAENATPEARGALCGLAASMRSAHAVLHGTTDNT